MAVDTGWLNNPNLLLLPIKSDSDRIDILKLSLFVIYFYCDLYEWYIIYLYDAPKIYILLIINIQHAKLLPITIHNLQPITNQPPLNNLLEVQQHKILLRIAISSLIALRKDQ